MKIRIYKTYMFKDKDPVIDEARTVWRDCGSPSYKEISEATNLSTNAISEWFDGKTIRPQNASIMAFMRGLGYDRQWVRKKKVEFKTTRPTKRK